MLPAGSAAPAAARLAGGASDEEGRLEVQLRPGGEYGGVYGGSTGDAQVVCRQLGKSGGVMHTFEPGYGGTPPPPVLANLRCTGDEAALAQCSFGAPTDGDRELYYSSHFGTIACAGGRLPAWCAAACSARAA